MPRRTGPDQILITILGVVLAAILVLLPFHAFFSTWGGTAIGPLLVWKSWKEILIFIAIPLVVWLCILRPGIAQAVWRSWLNKVIAGYVALHAILGLASAASLNAILAGLLMNLRFFAVFVLAQVIIAANPTWLNRCKTWLVGWLLGTGLVLGLLAMLQVSVLPRDFLAGFGYNKDTTISPYLLVDEDPNALRAFATMRGPNTLGAYLLLPLALAALLWWQNKRRWWAAGGGVVIIAALVATGSRSAWIGALAMIAALAFVVLPKARLLRWLKWGTIPLLVLAASMLWLATTVPQLRLAIFHSGGNTQDEPLLEGSTADHWHATLLGLQNFAQHPLGQGVGTAGPASFYNTNANPSIPENYFVQIGQEVGVAGLALFVIISVLVCRALWRQRAHTWPAVLLASFVGINVINIFLHGWADDPTALTWWAVAGLFVVQAKQK